MHKPFLGFLTILLLMVFGTSHSEELDVPEVKEPDGWSFYEATAIDVAKVVAINMCYEIYLSDYERFTRYNADECGLLVVPDKDIVQISYSYIRTVASCSVWFPGRDVFTADRYLEDRIETRIDDITTIDESWEPDLSEYSIDEQVKLQVLMRILEAEVSYIQYIDGYAGCHLGVPIDMEDVLLNMDDYWGVSISPKLNGTVRIHYECIMGGDQMEVSLYYNDELIHTFTAGTYSGTQGECEGDIVLQ